MADSYDHKEIEAKWQAEWEQSGLYRASEAGDKAKYYVLVEFPYPSGDGLHVGHPRPYIGMDIIARKRRMEGCDVLYPMGWDAFGLPTENYAIKTGIHPAIVTKQNSDNFRRQIQMLGASFDWSREINTTDPEYYKWTQWIFLQLYKNNLAYKAKTRINWCPSCKIGLANEEVIQDKCERCGSGVEQREKEQWLLAITKYADRLIDDLATVDYPEAVKAQQKNWIGRSEGAVIKFDDLEIFTTRPETIYGATYIAIAGQQDKFTGKTVINPATGQPIPVWEAEYVVAEAGTGAVMGVPAHDARDFAFAKKNDLEIRQVVEPVFTQSTEPGAFQEGKPFVYRQGIIAIIKHWAEEKYLGLQWKKVDWRTLLTGSIEEGRDPAETLLREVREETGFLNAKVVSEFGVVGGKYYHVPKQENRHTHGHILYAELQNDAQEKVADAEQAMHDLVWLSREELAKFLTPPTHQYAIKRWQSGSPCYEGSGILINSGEFDGLQSDEARAKMIAKFGLPKTSYKLRDWIFSRQRYWGEPIPMIFCEKCGWQPVPEADLPVVLPEVENYQPRDDGESPLASVPDWVNVPCPKCGGRARRETDVMPNWAGSSWYYLRYLDPDNHQALATPEKIKKWLPVDWYNGGMEHTTLHLLYSRFWHKFLFDIGVVTTLEPYQKRTSHGLILAAGGAKMSKSKGNVINPDKIVDLYGADTLRLYEMFMGPFEQAVAWSDESIIGCRRFLEKIWRLAQDKVAGEEGEVSSELRINLEKTIKKVSGDIEKLAFNTAVSQMMIMLNFLKKEAVIPRSVWRNFLIILAPFAPHLTEELWAKLGEKNSIHQAAWPISLDKKSSLE